MPSFQPPKLSKEEESNNKVDENPYSSPSSLGFFFGVGKLNDYSKIFFMPFPKSLSGCVADCLTTFPPSAISSLPAILPMPSSIPPVIVVAPEATPPTAGFTASIPPKV